MYPSHHSFSKLKLPEEIALAPKSMLQPGAGEVVAPTELLAQFLATIMKKDYKNALIFCKLVQQFEPTNATAKRFYPMIAKKLEMKEEIESEESEEESEEEEEVELKADEVAQTEGEGEGESSGDDSDSDIDHETGEALDQKTIMIEAQREIIERLRSKVVPPKKT